MTIGCVKWTEAYHRPLPTINVEPMKALIRSKNTKKGIPTMQDNFLKQKIIKNQYLINEIDVREAIFGLLRSRIN